MVFIILVSSAHTPVEGLLTLVPEVVTALGLITTNRGEVPAENLNSGPTYLRPKRPPAVSSKII
jgi:hypothetical protein